MKRSQRAIAVLICAYVALGTAVGAFAQDDVVELVVNLLGENDKDLRALAYEQVRSEVPGEAATKKFAELLSTVPAETQVGLLSALADRGDQVAAPAVRLLLKSSDNEAVRVAAIKALGGLGEAADLGALTKLALHGSAAVKAAARRSLVVLPGSAPSAAMAAELSKAPAPECVMLLEILATRRARDAVPAIVKVAQGDDPVTRRGAMTALGQLAAPEHVAGMVRGVLKAERGRERDAAEKAIMLVCRRGADSQDPAQPLLDVMSAASKQDRTTLLSTLGRVGGPAALAVVEQALRDADATQHEAGLRALCNWPDASTAFRLLELARTEKEARHRRMALRSLIRIAPLPGDNSDQFRLDLLRTAWAMCGEDADRLQVLERAKAVRTIDTLRFVLPYTRQPAFAEQACLTVVELAHQSGLREAHKAEFHRALDQVIEISQDAVVVDRARRYKKGETWVRPKGA